MDIESLEELSEQSFSIDVEYTLGELEWEKLVGPSGLSRELLRRMRECGADFFQITDVRHTDTSEGELIEFRIDDEPCRIRFDYDVPYTETLLTGLRRFLNGVNTCLRRAGLHWRYVCIRRRDEASGFSYSIALVPEAHLIEFNEVFDVVAGMSLEDYESIRPNFSPETDGGTSEVTI